MAMLVGTDGVCLVNSVVGGSAGVARWVPVPLLLCRPWFWPFDKPREILTVPWREGSVAQPIMLLCIECGFINIEDVI